MLPTQVVRHLNLLLELAEGVIRCRYCLFVQGWPPMKVHYHFAVECYLRIILVQTFQELCSDVTEFTAFCKAHDVRAYITALGVAITFPIKTARNYAEIDWNLSRLVASCWNFLPFSDGRLNFIVKELIWKPRNPTTWVGFKRNFFLFTINPRASKVLQIRDTIASSWSLLVCMTKILSRYTIRHKPICLKKPSTGFSSFMKTCGAEEKPNGRHWNLTKRISGDVGDLGGFGFGNRHLLNPFSPSNPFVGVGLVVLRWRPSILKCFTHTNWFKALRLMTGHCPPLFQPGKSGRQNSLRVVYSPLLLPWVAIPEPFVSPCVTMCLSCDRSIGGDIFDWCGCG